MKKALIFSLTMLAFMLSAQSVYAYAPRAGDLVKVSGNPAVYFVDSAGYRHLFPTQDTFFSWRTGTWRDQSIVTISGWELNQLPAGQNITIRPGSSLVRFDNSLVMYAVLPGSKLCNAPAHYGNYQYNRAKVIPSGFQSDYVGSGTCDITQSTNLPEGTLLRYKNSNDIYYIQNGQKRRVTATGMTTNFLRYESVVYDVDWSMSYPEGPILDGYDSSISDANRCLFGYGSSGQGYCSENWSCAAWSNCSGNYQYRSCSDQNNCGTTVYKPATGQSCSSYNYNCQENWSCGAWSTCAYGRSYRNCSDLNSCGTAVSRPAESQSCATACQENWTCGSWGSCQTSGLSNGWQFRSCNDLNSCGTTRSRPALSQVCQTCQTDWSCTGWTDCRNGSQNRSCLDLNGCGTSSGRPSLTRSCN